MGAPLRGPLPLSSRRERRLWRDYLRTAIDYVHLNPGRASLVDGVEKRVADYPWSSLASGYNLPPSKRPQWLAAAEVLDLFQERDTLKGRRQFLGRLDHFIRDKKGLPEVEGATVEDRIKRGWFRGGAEHFKESMLQLYENQLKAKGENAHGMNRTYRASRIAQDHGVRQAEAIVKRALHHFGLREDQIKRTVRSDLTRAAIADRIFRETTVSQESSKERIVGIDQEVDQSQYFLTDP